MKIQNSQFKTSVLPVVKFFGWARIYERTTALPAPVSARSSLGSTASVGTCFLRVRISSPAAASEQARYTYAPAKEPVVVLIHPVT